MCPIVKVALDCESFGQMASLFIPVLTNATFVVLMYMILRPLLRTEFNIEGYPSPEFIDLGAEGKTTSGHIGSR